MDSMFLPKDLTSSEEELVATINREMRDHRCPATPAEEQAVAHEATQLAAEMIWEARGEQYADDPKDEDTDLAESSEYHQRLAKLLETNLAIQRLEDREADERR